MFQIVAALLHALSFPRKRESHVKRTDYHEIPACAGMTGCDNLKFLKFARKKSGVKFMVLLN